MRKTEKSHPVFLHGSSFFDKKTHKYIDFLLIIIEFYKIYLVDNTKNSVMIITEATKQKGRDKHGAGGKSEKPGNGNGRAAAE